MLDKRREFHQVLCDVLGSKNVYFQPPETQKIIYPCFVYKVSTVDVKRANNKLYLGKVRYMVTLIDRNPDSKFFDKVMELPYTSFATSFRTEGLNHFVFEIYY